MYTNYTNANPHTGVFKRQAAPVEPEWVFPNGNRQERSLAYLGAAAVWGEDLVTASLAAAGQHLELGTRGDWREFVIEVPSPIQNMRKLP